MALIIADTFAASLGKLTKQEQSAVKQTAFDLQVNPENPGLSFHRIDKSKDKYFWSVRVNRDIRIIIHKRGDSMLMAYVDHHDDAYKWAEKRRLDVHPRTGAAQIVVLREHVEDVVVHRSAAQEISKPAVLGGESRDTLLDRGLPEDWLDEVRKATEDTLLDVCRYLPAEASEAVLNLATGIRPPKRKPGTSVDPFDHPNVKGQFWKLGDTHNLREAMRGAAEQVRVSLDSGQKAFVEHFYTRTDRSDDPGFDAQPTSGTGLEFRRRRTTRDRTD